MKLEKMSAGFSKSELNKSQALCRQGLDILRTFAKNVCCPLIQCTDPFGPGFIVAQHVDVPFQAVMACFRAALAGLRGCADHAAAGTAHE
eukprot:4482839-Pleurochrysis_carterae.AAC.2